MLLDFTISRVRNERRGNNSFVLSLVRILDEVWRDEGGIHSFAISLLVYCFRHFET